MPISAPMPAEDLDQSHWNVLRHAVRRFETAWKESSRPELSRFLPAVDGCLRLRILIELIVVDQEYRWRAGEQAFVERYLPTWPELGERPDILSELLTKECATRAALGAIPTGAELVARFPEIAVRIDLQQILAEAIRESAGESTDAVPTSCYSLDRNSAPSTGPLQRGDVLDRYTIEGLIGSGGMGIVYLAHDRKLDRQVALKIPRPEVLADPHAARQFLDEARAAAKLRHPNVCTIYHADEVAGLPFFAMELASGPNLPARIRQGAIEPDEAVRIARCIAEAVACLHAADIVHRDIKPGNVMFDERGEPMLTDFGLASRPGAEGEGINHWTAGTPAYMSPEQIAGADVDGRADVYSLGVVLYQTLTGTLPAAGTANRILFSGGTHASGHLSVTPAVADSELARICARATAADPDDRFQTAGDLAAALKAWQSKRLARRPLSWLKGALASAVLTFSLVLLLFASGWPGISDNAQPVANSASNESPLARAVREAHETIYAEIFQNPAPDQQLVSNLRRELLGLCRAHPGEPQVQKAAQLINMLSWPPAGESDDGAIWHNLTALPPPEGPAFELQLPADGSLAIRRQYKRSHGKHPYRLSYERGPIAIQIVAIDEGLHPFLTTRNSQSSNTEGRSGPVLYHVFPETRSTAPDIVDLGVQIWGNEKLATEKWYVMHIWPLASAGEAATEVMHRPEVRSPKADTQHYDPERLLAQIEHDIRQFAELRDPEGARAAGERILALFRDHPHAAALPRAGRLLADLPWPESTELGTTGLWLRPTDHSTSADGENRLAPGTFLVIRGSCTAEALTDVFRLRLDGLDAFHIHAVSLTPSLTPHLREYWDRDSNSQGGWTNGTLYQRFELPTPSNGSIVDLHVRLHDRFDNRNAGDYLLYVWPARPQ